MTAKIKHHTALIIGTNLVGMEDDHVQIKILDEYEMEEVVIGEYVNEEGSYADPILAIRDAIKTLHVLIARLEKLEKTKNPMDTSTHEKVNEINHYFV